MADEKRCKTCKWWDTPADSRACQWCAMLGAISNAYPMGLYSASSDGDNDAIYTGPDFGCVHWEAKDD